MGRIPGELIPIIAIIGAVAIAIFMPLARAYAKRMEQGSTHADPEIAARLERMEHAIESIAIEIERVSEGQRFTTRLLSEQKGVRLPVGNEPEGRT